MPSPAMPYTPLAKARTLSFEDMLEATVRIAVVMDAPPSAAAKVSEWPAPGAASGNGAGYVARRLVGLVAYFIDDFLADGGSLV